MQKPQKANTETKNNPSIDKNIPTKPNNPIEDKNIPIVEDPLKAKVRLNVPCETPEECTAKAIADKNNDFCNFIIPLKPWPNELSNCFEQVGTEMNKAGAGK